VAWAVRNTALQRASIRTLTRTSPGEKMGVRPPICPNLLQVCALGSADSAAGMSWGIAWVGLEGGSAPAPIPATSRMTKATQYSLLLTVCDRGWPAIALWVFRELTSLIMFATALLRGLSRTAATAGMRALHRITPTVSVPVLKQVNARSALI
jgi:hypothetical protein